MPAIPGSTGYVTVKLIDLGVARLSNLGEFDAPDMPEAESPGTPSFMAPELFLGTPADTSSDLFALGVTIFRLFTGAYPYGEIEPFSHPRFGRPQPLSITRPDLPA